MRKEVPHNEKPRGLEVEDKMVQINRTFFLYPLSSGIASCVGTAGTVLDVALLVALGQVLIWVVLRNSYLKHMSVRVGTI